MAQAKTASGVRQLLIKVGDGADPEAFTHPCTINSQRGLQLTADTNDVVVPDCADPDLMAWVEREKVSLSGAITGEGTLNTPDLDLFWEWFESPDPKNVMVVVDVDAADGGRIFTGPFLLTAFELAGEPGNKAQASITLQSSGAIVKSNNT